MSVPAAAFITLDSAIKKAMVAIGETTEAMYQRYMQWAMIAVDELNCDVFKNFQRTFLGVDGATQSAKLPDDYAQMVRIGLMTQNNEFVPLAYNPSLITTVEVPECDTIEDHCDCGCNDELCAAIGHSNISTTTEDVVINGTTYTKTISVCTSSDGKVIRKICQPTVTNPTQTCNYQITFSRTTSELTGHPWSNFYLTKNNQQIFVGDVANSAALTTIMDANGFSLVSQGVSSIVYGITATPNVWTIATYNDTDGGSHRVEFAQSSCVTPTPTVETICYEEEVCDVEVLPCGCIKPTDLQIQVLFNTCPFLCAVTSRQRWNKDFGQTFAQPKGFFGEYAIDVYNGIVRFNWDFQYNSCFLEYYSMNVVDSKNYLIPAQALKAIIAHCHYMQHMKPNTPEVIFRRYEKIYYNEKRKLKGRLHPLNLDEMMQAMRVFQRP